MINQSGVSSSAGEMRREKMKQIAHLARISHCDAASVHLGSTGHLDYHGQVIDPTKIFQAFKSARRADLLNKLA
jgi:hypothetical protein